MVKLEDVSGSLLQKPSDATHHVPSRTASSYKPLHTFDLAKQRSYKQQYGDMYFLRLTKIKPAVEKLAAKAWEQTVIGGERAKRVERVLDVRQGELCWVAGTVYMDMPLKPNILVDVSKDKNISAKRSATSIYYSKEEDENQVMLEDDSGRIRLVGDLLKSLHLVTGCIIAVMGTENAGGELEVIDVKFPDLSPQPERWFLSKAAAANGAVKKEDKDEDEEMTDGTARRNNKIAIVSGLSFSRTDASHALELDLLLEYLLGEALGAPAQEEISSISRLIIAGDSITVKEKKKKKHNQQDDKDSSDDDDDDDDDDEDDSDDGSTEKKTNKKYGYDASAYNPVPSQLFDGFLSEILPSIPVTLLPGDKDPANASYPQQPIHAAMFPQSRVFCKEPSSSAPGWFDTVTNPWEGEVEGWRILGTSGQNVNDIFKYVGTDDRLGMMEAMCRWRLSAPTAPDTLWSYPFQDNDPFVMDICPHLYFVGCQPKFSTKTIHGPEGQSVRLITVPSFAETKELVLVDTETLEVKVVKISAS